MLSRVAESLYWMSRYIERAEDTTRILNVNFHTLIETPEVASESGWQALVTITGDQELYGTLYKTFTARNVIEFLLWHPENPNAVTTCITQARENARGVREQISVEMWEHINRLYFLIREVNRKAILRGPHEFFRQVRDGSQAFQGIADATMIHGQPYEFIQLGKYLERADKTVRILDVKYAAINHLPEGSSDASLQLVAMLKSCSAFEPFRKTYAAQILASRVAEYLLLNRAFPRAVFFSLEQCRQSLEAIAADPQHPKAVSSPQRLIGRLCAELNYLDIQEVFGPSMDPYLNQLLKRINSVDEEIAKAYFNTQVVLPGLRPQQAQQQQ